MVPARRSEHPGSWQQHSNDTDNKLGGIASRMLETLCDAIASDPLQRRRAHDLFSHMTHSWAHREAGGGPQWCSDITDDGTPFEFSLAFTEGKPRLRFLVESQGASIGDYSTWDAGIELNARLERAALVDLTRFGRVQELFRPQPGRRAVFYLWHAAVVPEAGASLVKVYFNPNVHGAAAAPDLIKEAMERLGHRASWILIEPRLHDTGNRPLFFSLDLHGGGDARIKVYLGRADSGAAIDRLIEGAANVRTGDASRLIGTLLDRVDGFAQRPILSCFAFKQPGAAPHVALHVPVRCYIDSDAGVISAMRRCLSAPDADTLTAAVTSLAGQPLTDSKGVVTYASFARAAHSEPDVTVYLAPQLYSRFGAM